MFHRVRTPTAKASHRPTDRPKDRLYANSIAATRPSLPDVFLRVPWSRIFRGRIGRWNANGISIEFAIVATSVAARSTIRATRFDEAFQSLRGRG